jgi:NTF2 fold immunity protein of polymorphic toxin system component
MTFWRMATFLFFLSAASATLPDMQAGARISHRNYVPDDNTAIKIAEAVLIPIYGAQQIAGERPFHAVPTAGVWKIEGTLHTSNGGVAIVQLQSRDGKIISVIHGK